MYNYRHSRQLSAQWYERYLLYLRISLHENDPKRRSYMPNDTPFIHIFPEAETL